MKVRKYFGLCALLVCISGCVTVESTGIDDFSISNINYFSIESVGAENAKNTIPDYEYNIAQIFEESGLRYDSNGNENNDERIIIKYIIRRSVMTGSEVTIQVLSMPYRKVLYSVVGKSNIGIPSSDIPKAAAVAIKRLRSEIITIMNTKTS